MPEFEILDSISQLRDSATQWDDLWRRSDVTMPSLRAELVAQWVEQFAPDKAFRAIVVSSDGQLVAALPLIGFTIGRLIESGGLTSDSWSPSGELLLDETTCDESVLNVLVSALTELPWDWLWLDTVRFEAPSWQMLIRALKRAGLPAELHERVRIGEIEIRESWEECRQSWSKNLRKSMKRAASRLAKEGEVRFRVESDLQPNQVPERLQQGFEVEDRSWKGISGTSVLRSRGMLEFFTRQAMQLAEWGQLELAWLEVNLQPIAFEYGWNAKGVYHSFKVGYDERFSAYSPGQLLICRLLERFHQNEQVRLMDCMGPTSDAISRWRPKTHGVGRLVVSLQRRVLGQALFYGYKHWWPRVRNLRNKLTRSID